ncbi:MAG: hypothetical protein KGO83_01350 [Paenibacillaceae bacterium]|jgi:hypothetical protein|nr:hypothetical protein [Paenibacillaceae bacterium]
MTGEQFMLFVLPLLTIAAAIAVLFVWGAVDPHWKTHKGGASSKQYGKKGGGR